MRTNIFTVAMVMAVALPGCGAKPVAATSSGGPAATTSVQVSPTPLEPGEALTAIDAARGDGASLPPDWYGPSAYDLRQRAEAGEAQPGERVARAEPAKAAKPAGGSSDGAAIDLLGADETVTTGG